MRYKKGLFGFSADPITLGHLHVIEKSLEQCETLVVLVANNPKKEAAYTFSLEERAALTAAAIETLPQDLQSRITVISTSGLLVDVYLTEHCDVIVRGIRNSHDELVENEQRSLYTIMLPELSDRFLYIEADQAYSAISSSWAKELVRSHVDISALVPLNVKAALEFRLHEQKFIGITGPIASGKTTAATTLVHQLKESLIDAHHIAIDDLVRALYTEDSLGAQAARDQIITRFGSTVEKDSGTAINTAELARALFSGSLEDIATHRSFVEELTAPHITRLFRERIRGLAGIILVEWSDYLSQNPLSLVNNTVILLDTDLKTRKRYAAKRGLEETLFQTINQIQKSAAEMHELITQSSTEYGRGRCIVMNPETPVDEIIDQILSIQSLPFTQSS